MDIRDERWAGVLGPTLLIGAMVILLLGCGGSSGSSTVSSTADETTQAARPPHVSRVRVPDLVGERFGKAVRDVEALGLQQHAPAFTGTVGNPHYNGHCQKILHQTPPPGTSVQKGSTISIVYGVCPKAIQHPRRQPRG
jgi:hypothetical protein